MTGTTKIIEHSELNMSELAAVVGGTFRGTPPMAKRVKNSLKSASN